MDEMKETLREALAKAITEAAAEKAVPETGATDQSGETVDTAGEWMPLLLAAYYNVASEQIDSYGGNTDRLAVFLQGVNALACEMISLAGQMGQEDA